MDRPDPDHLMAWISDFRAGVAAGMSLSAHGLVTGWQLPVLYGLAVLHDGGLLHGVGERYFVVGR